MLMRAKSEPRKDMSGDDQNEEDGGGGGDATNAREKITKNPADAGRGSTTPEERSDDDDDDDVGNIPPPGAFVEGRNGSAKLDNVGDWEDETLENFTEVGSRDVVVEEGMREVIRGLVWDDDEEWEDVAGNSGIIEVSGGGAKAIYSFPGEMLPAWSSGELPGAAALPTHPMSEPIDFFPGLGVSKAESAWHGKARNAYDAQRKCEKMNDATLEDPFDPCAGGGNNPNSGRCSCFIAFWKLIACYTILLAGLLAGVMVNLTHNTTFGQQQNVTALEPDTDEVAQSDPSIYGADGTNGDIGLANVYSYEVDLSMYGYPYTASLSAGRLSWPKDVSLENFASFVAPDRVTSVELCAAECRGANAQRGAWDVEYKKCWCTFLDSSEMCREPCVEGVYLHFGERPVDAMEIDYCVVSMCDEGRFHGEMYCAERFGFDKDACDRKIETIKQRGNFSAEMNLLKFGYPHIRHVTSSAGWLSWPRDFEEHNFSSYDADGGVTSMEECAARCLETNATTGAWDLRDEACWCDSVGLEEDLCKEPCVEAEYIEFSFVPFAEFDYCETSVCDDDWRHVDRPCVHDFDFDKDACHDKIEALFSFSYVSSSSSSVTTLPTSSAEEIDLSMFGYPYAQHTTLTGWLSWPLMLDVEFDLLSYDAEDGVTSAKECAAKCQEAKVPVGVWDVKYGDCFCSSLAVEEHCREPCVAEEYINFSTAPYAQLDYCATSACDMEWYLSMSDRGYSLFVYREHKYCDDYAGFDKDVCDARIEALASSLSSSVAEPPTMSTTNQPTASPTKEPSKNPMISPTLSVALKPAMSAEEIGPSSPEHAGSVLSEIDVDPSAMATTKISSPDAKDEGLINFSVENGKERVSFVRFDLSFIAESSVVDSATLHLYLIRSVLDSEEDDVFKVFVHSLPQSGDWTTGSVSHNEPLMSEGELLVASFEVIPLDPSTERTLYAVDVTSAIDNARNNITFKLSTASDVRLDFAGESWNDGESVPWLRVRAMNQSGN